jgi:anti-anti-sigma factor
VADGQLFERPGPSGVVARRLLWPVDDGGDALNSLGSSSSHRGDSPGLGTSDFSIDDDGSGRLALRGELDLAGAPDLEQALQARIGDVTLDCHDLAFIDSTGLHVLISNERRLSADGYHLTLEGVRPGCRRVFEITGLDAAIRIKDR